MLLRFPIGIEIDTMNGILFNQKTCLQIAKKVEINFVKISTIK